MSLSGRLSGGLDPRGPQVTPVARSAKARSKTPTALSETRPTTQIATRDRAHCQSVAMELDQSRVTDPEVMRDLVEHDVSNLAAYTIGVAGSESRDRPAEDADLVGKHSAVRAAPSRQRYTAV